MPSTTYYPLSNSSYVTGSTPLLSRNHSRCQLELFLKIRAIHRDIFRTQTHVALCRSCCRSKRKAHYEEYITRSIHLQLYQTQMINCLPPLKNPGSHQQDSKLVLVQLDCPSLRLSRLHCTNLFYVYQIDIFLRINETSFFPQLSALLFNGKQWRVHEIFSKKQMEMKMVKT